VNIKKIQELSELFCIATTLNNLLDNMSLEQATFVLRLSEDATEEDIKRSYRKLAKIYHPDVVGGDDMRFKLLNKAKNVMLDHVKTQDEVVVEPEKSKEYGKLRLVPSPTERGHNWGDWYSKEIGK
jgi:preprotein translocase subunit Sec63